MNSGQKFNRDLLTRILKLRNLLELDNREFAESLGVTPRELSQIRLNGQDLSIQNLEKFCQAIQLNINNLFSGKIDYATVARHFRGDLMAMPEAYQGAEFRLGKLRAIQSIFEFMNLFYGFDYARMIL